MRAHLEEVQSVMAWLWSQTKLVEMRSRDSQSGSFSKIPSELHCSVSCERKRATKIHRHDAERSSRSSSTGVLLCHLFMMCFYVFVHVYDTMIYNQHESRWFSGKGESLYGGRWKFLTYINLWVQFIYFTFSFLTDIITWRKIRPVLQECCTILFTTLALPMALLVGVLFWSIYAIDRELIYPAANDEYIPFILNHFWHTTVVVCVLVELAIVFHRYPTTPTALFVTYLVGGAYLFWVTWVFSISGRWPYPFLHALPFLPLFFLGTLLISPGMFFCGKALCYLRWHSKWN